MNRLKRMIQDELSLDLFHYQMLAAGIGALGSAAAIAAVDGPMVVWTYIVNLLAR
jgi:hypothetical protein